MAEFVKLYRPGYFGRARDSKLAALNTRYGEGNWKLVWVCAGYNDMEFVESCGRHYERSYVTWFDHMDTDTDAELDFICSFRECIDNSVTNIESGTDYSHQESFSTHIQDIAIRNVLCAFDRKFTAERDTLLVIRSANSQGYKYGPGNIPFHTPSLIEQPSMRPHWANKDSVEDFWQSNKYIAVREDLVLTQ